MRQAIQKALSWCKMAVHRVAGGLIMEPKGENNEWLVSLGRTAFWMAFGHMCWLWHQGKVPDQTEMAAFYALLGYQGGKMVGDKAWDMVQVFRGPPGATKV